MRHVPKNHPATPLLHFGNATLTQKSTVRTEVARPERDADVERGALPAEMFTIKARRLEP
jgi:hypothetical protein